MDTGDAVKPVAVRLQSRITRGTEVYTITVPKDFVKKLGWSKGDVLVTKIIEYEGREAIVIYRI